MTNDKEVKLVFAPGCFDSFEGDQSELDSLMAEIQAAFDTGELMGMSRPVDMETMDPEDLAAIERAINNKDGARVLQ